VVWALAGVGACGAMHNRREAVNMAAAFGGLHFYTQWFERLSATPEMVIAANLESTRPMSVRQGSVAIRRGSSGRCAVVARLAKFA
jgi:hypothetical protein